MEYNLREKNNAALIDSLEYIIKQEKAKLEIDKTAVKQNENTDTQNIPLRSHTPKLNHSCDRVDEIDRLANLFSHSPSYFTKNSYNNSFDVKHNQVLLNEKIAVHNVFDNYNNVLVNTENRENLVSPDIKVRRNVRFGEYSPLNPANQVNAQPYLGIGEYESKRKKILELQRKEYIDHFTKAKQENNVSNLPKLPAFSCAEAFKSAMEKNNNSEQNKLGGSIGLHQEDTKQIVPPFVDGIESCAFDEEQIKNANKLKQELYRFELSKQIEEKKKFELDQKRKEQMEDDKIERAAIEQENKIQRAYDKEARKQTMAQLQIQHQQEKLKHEIMQRQNNLEKKTWSMPSVTVPRQEKLNNETKQKTNDLGIKSWNMTSETLPQQISKHEQCREQFVENCDIRNMHAQEEFHYPLQSTFDNLPLPTTRFRVPRKITYNEEADIIDRSESCDKDMFENPCISPPPVVRQKMERAHVSFAKDPPMQINEYNPAALLPVTKNLIIDSPLTLALAGLSDNRDDFVNVESIEPIEETYRNQISKKVLLGKNHELPTDKHLLSNLGNIRKQLDIEHQKLKQQVRSTQ